MRLLRPAPDPAIPDPAVPVPTSHLAVLAAGIYRRLCGGGHFGAVARVMTFRALALFANFGTGILAAAFLGPSGRGELAALLVGPQFVGALSMFGLPMAYIYNAKTDPDRRGSYLGCALLLSVPFSLVMVAVSYQLTPLWLGDHGTATVHIAQLLLFSVPVSVLIPLLTGVLDAQGRFGLSSSIQYLQPIGTLICLGVTIGFGRLSATTAAISYTLPTVLTCLCAAWQAVRFVRPVPTLAAPFRSAMLSYGFRQYGFEVFGSLAVYIDQITVVYLLTPTAVGTYAVALSLARILGAMQDVIWSVLFPNIAGRSLLDVLTTVSLVVRITVIPSTAVALALGLLGPYAVTWIYGHAYAAAATPFRILLAAMVVMSAARLFGHVFSATGRPGMVTFIEAVGVCTVFAVMMLLVPAIGAAGAACAVLAGATVRLGCVLCCVRMVLRLPIPRLFPNRSDLNWVINRSRPISLQAS